MSPVSAMKFWAPLMVALGALLSMCASLQEGAALPGTDLQTQEDTAQLLHGTWVREYTTHGAQARRTLTLGATGAFRETVDATDETGRKVELVHEGTWLYDGTNLKRKYTLMNGRPPSRLNLPFATFQIEFVSRNEFVGVDHIRGNRIDYHRITTETPALAEHPA